MGVFFGVVSLVIGLSKLIVIVLWVLGFRVFFEVIVIVVFIGVFRFRRECGFFVGCL